MGFAAFYLSLTTSLFFHPSHAGGYDLQSSELLLGEYRRWDSQERRHVCYQLIFIWKIAMKVVKGYSIDFVNDGRLVIPKFVNNPIVPSVRRSSIEKGLQAECPHFAPTSRKFREVFLLFPWNYHPLFKKGSSYCWF